ncbi:hypothetical protein Ava_0029 [Trichormus variabilis ATCC 29413]|uniref:Uncharacterized protein n=1 Tax=Trichormus variabilis (strain ATCC 29413 / PCC 7937) TaxID=240292 RepID=Q3MH81_TRIV2|nr:hypothetical protein Ava_0029 [Trichormus variabilis ATCC 29413]
MRAIRQGDVILLPMQEVTGEMIPHLTLAEGEFIGHQRHITEDEAQLFQQGDTLDLRVFSETALLDRNLRSSEVYKEIRGFLTQRHAKVSAEVRGAGLIKIIRFVSGYVQSKFKYFPDKRVDSVRICQELQAVELDS